MGRNDSNPISAMKIISFLAASAALAALPALAQAACAPTLALVELPALVVQSTRLAAPEATPAVVPVSVDLGRVRARANLEVRIDMHRTLGRGLRRLAFYARRGAVGPVGPKV